MGTINDKIEYLEETKQLIKEAIIEKNVPVSENDTFRSYADKINSITGIDTSDATATANDILTNKTAYVDGEKITGTIPMQEQVITPSTQRQDISTGYHSNSYVEGVTAAIDSNIKSSNIKSGVSILGVEGNVEPDKPDQTKTVNPSTQIQIVEPDIGYELASVTVNPMQLESKTVTPSTLPQVINPSTGKDGINQVNVDAVDNTIDSNIKSNNIKSGVSILGVDGLVVEKNAQSKTVNPSTLQQVITPDNNYNALDQVTVNAVDNTIDANIQSDNIKSGVTILGVAGKSSVVDTESSDAIAINIRKDKTAYVNGQKITGTLPVLTYPSGDFDSQFIAGDAAYTKTRDNKDYLVGTYQVASASQPDSWMFEGNRKMKLGIPYSLVANKLGITANKIKQGETIAGVSGNVVPVNNESTRTVNPTTSAQDITPASGYTGLSKVTVNGVTSSIDSNIQAENIKSGVEILGVTGNYTGEGSSYPPNWSQIGYSTTPQSLLDDFAYSKQLYDDWDASIANRSGSNSPFYYDTQLVYLPNVDLSNVTNMYEMCRNASALKCAVLNITNGDALTNLESVFQSCSSLTDVTVNINKTTIYNLSTKSMFYYCSKLVNAPAMDLSKITKVEGMFRNCTKLENVPVYNLSNLINDITDMFASCPNLSNDSLNNIMATLASVGSKYRGTKTLKKAGLSQTQATTCQELSNYQMLLDAGWTTGY